LAKRILCLLLAVGLILSLVGCGGSRASGYRVVGTLPGQDLCLAFRDGDKLRDIFTAGLMTLSADGTLGTLSQRWFGENRTDVPGDAEMAAWLQNQPPRTLILGYYPAARPLCYEENGAVTGFDAELMGELCARLGWTLAFQPIARGEAGVELASGNVDCVAGGFGSGEDAAGLSFSPSYLHTDYAFVARADGDIRRSGQLSGKVLATVGGSAMGKALEADKLFPKLGGLLVLGDEDQCFAALRERQCDAILVSSLSAEVYMK
jgi:ABC-type amino acid transport substrate-binding protein